MADAPQNLADSILRVRNDLADTLFAQAEVIADSGRGVRVNMLGTNSTWPCLSSYTPIVGDIVLMAGSPGSWVCLGSLEGRGRLDVTTLNASGTVTSDRVVTAGLTVNGGATVNGFAVILGNIDATSFTSGDTTVNGSGIAGPSGQFGGVVINGGGIDCNNRSIGGIVNADMVTLSCGSSHINSGGFSGIGAGFSGNVTANDMTTSAGYYTYGSYQGGAYRSNHSNCAINWSNDDAAGVVAWDGSVFKGIRSSNFATVPSWRRLKMDFQTTEEYLGETALDVVKRLDIRAWRHDPDLASFADGKTYYGLMLEELPEPLVTPGADDEDGSSYDVGSMVNVALKAIQDQQEHIEALTARVETLTARVEALEAARE